MKQKLTKKGVPPKKTGPKGPQKPMDDKLFAQLIAMIRIQCTRDEICGVMGMSEVTLDKRIKEHGHKNFLALYEKHGHEGKASLRRTQFKVALGDENENIAPNPTMLIWLGKQWLGQKDKSESEVTLRPPPHRIELVGVKIKKIRND